MKKLIKKFIILAVISMFIGYSATKDKVDKNEYIENDDNIVCENILDIVFK